MLRVFGIMTMPPNYVVGEVPDFPLNQLHRWSMPMTDPELRGTVWEF